MDNYIINVASRENGHVFRTDGIGSESTALFVVSKLRIAFPEPKYEITMTKWNNVGQFVDLSGV